MKKILFIDRDGTIIKEPPTTYQVDDFNLLAFERGAISTLARIFHTLDYEFVMVTNQDGLGTSSFPEERFWGPHNLMVEILASEGIRWREIIIDRTFAKDNAPTRKPGTHLVNHYLQGDFAIDASFVIGDRTTDMLFAKNLGAKGILLGRSSDTSDDHISTEHDLSSVIALTTNSWDAIYEFLKNLDRTTHNRRTTAETDISIDLNLDGSGQNDITTGIGFFDHMLAQIAKHGQLDLTIKVNGDLHIDSHHTIEDTALALGEAFRKCLGNKRGIDRYGFTLPMDDCLAQVALDFGGRPWIVWDATFSREKVGEMPTEMFFHFFKSFSDASLSNLHITATGTNEHHKIEAIFKAFAKAIRKAINRDEKFLLPSTKGSL